MPKPTPDYEGITQAAQRLAREQSSVEGSDPQSTGTVDPKRPITSEEFAALVAIETVERLMVKVYRLLTTEEFTEADRLTAQSLLESAVDVTTTRTCSAVKQMEVSDSISARARTKVQRIVEDTERRVAEATAPAPEETQG